LRTVTLGGNTIASLPATEAEIEQIAQVFDQNGKRAKAYLYNKAAEDALKSNTLQKHRFIHIATHGFVNEDQPDLSGLLFYPDTASAEDHILYTGEIYSLPLQADLVVLSACETGLGENVKGEGLLGLSRAFLYAGARNLMVSLWKVQDQATSDLMVDFYRQYWQNESLPYSAPLHQAKLNMIQSKQFNHPYYWSAFVLIGD
jgi:CHAT domain-containing protein